MINKWSNQHWCTLSVHGGTWRRWERRKRRGIWVGYRPIERRNQKSNGERGTNGRSREKKYRNIIHFSCELSTRWWCVKPVLPYTFASNFEQKDKSTRLPLHTMGQWTKITKVCERTSVWNQKKPAKMRRPTFFQKRRSNWTERERKNLESVSNKRN